VGALVDCGELSAQRFKFFTKGWTEEAIIAHLDKARGQDMLHAKRAVDEFLGGQRAELGLTRVGFVTKRDLVVLHLDDAVVAEGDAKDVGGEILESRATIADGLAVNDPVLLPHSCGDVGKTVGLAQGITDIGVKELGQRLDGEQEIRCNHSSRVIISAGTLPSGPLPNSTCLAASRQGEKQWGALLPLYRSHQGGGMTLRYRVRQPYRQKRQYLLRRRLRGRTTRKPAAKTLAAGLSFIWCGDDGRRNPSYFGIIIVDLSATMPITI
jgi:hypothetical protein